MYMRDHNNSVVIPMFSFNFYVVMIQNIKIFFPAIERHIDVMMCVQAINLLTTLKKT